MSAAIWGWADRLSDEINRRDKATKLSALINFRSCGDCRLWMTQGCRREVHDNKIGRSRGPSMNARPCSDYAETPHSAQMRQNRRDELRILMEGTKP